MNANYYEWYNYNNLNQKTEVQITNGTSTLYDVLYNYYANGWLYEVQLGPASAPTNVATYSYDSAGNRTSIALSNGTSTG